MTADAPALEGSFRDAAELERLLASLMSQKVSAMLRLEGEKGLGLLWLRDGLLVEARQSGLSGPSALASILTTPRGRYWLQPGQVDIAVGIPGGNAAFLREVITHLGEWCRLRDALPPLSSKLNLDREALYRAAPELTPQDVKILKAAKQGHPIYRLGPETGLSDLILFRRLIHLLRLHLISESEGSVPPPPEHAGFRSAPVVEEPANEPLKKISERPESGYSVRGSGLIESVTVASPKVPSARPLAQRKSSHPRLFARSDTPPPVIPKAPPVPANVGVVPSLSANTVSKRPIIETTGVAQAEPSAAATEGFVSAEAFARTEVMRGSNAPSTARQFQTEPPPVTPVQFGSQYPRPLEAQSLLEPAPRVAPQYSLRDLGAPPEQTAGYQTPIHQTPNYQTPIHQTPGYQTPSYQPAPEVSSSLAPAGHAPAPRWTRRSDRPFALSEYAAHSSPQDLLLQLPTRSMEASGYLWGIFGSLLLGAGSFLGAWLTNIPALNFVGGALLLAHVAVWMAFASRMWGALRGSKKALSNARVLWPLFIPVFGYVWWVRLWLRYVRLYNDIVVRTRIHAPQLSEGMVWAAFLLPGVGYLFAWSLVGKVCEGVSLLATAAEQRQRRHGANAK